MSTQVFLSGLMLGLLFGVLLCYVALRFVSRARVQGRKREVDQLAEDFQALFREIDQDKA